LRMFASFDGTCDRVGFAPSPLRHSALHLHIIRGSALRRNRQPRHASRLE
jgi:hypothetical protein